MKILYIGDLHIKKKLKKITGIEKVFSDADFVVVNLEGPIVKSNKRISKVGPHLNNNECLVDIFPKNTIFSLANNHIMDFGSEGLEYTRSILNSKGFLYGGAGPTLNIAREPLLLEKGNESLALFFRAENELNISSEKFPGVAPIDLTGDYDLIASLKDQGYLIIFYIHGGTEFSPYSNLFQRETTESLYGFGVDKVFWTHSHMLSPVLSIDGKDWFPGLGNFYFDSIQTNNISNPFAKKIIRKMIGIELYEKWKNIFSKFGLGVISDTETNCDKVFVLKYFSGGVEVLDCVDSKSIFRMLKFPVSILASDCWKNLLFFNSRWTQSKFHSDMVVNLMSKNESISLQKKNYPIIINPLGILFWILYFLWSSRKLSKII